MSLGLCLRASDCENAWQVGLARRAENAGCLFTPPLLNSPRLVGPTCVGAKNIKARTGPDSGSQRQRRTWAESGPPAIPEGRQDSALQRPPQSRAPGSTAVDPKRKVPGRPMINCPRPFSSLRSQSGLSVWPRPDRCATLSGLWQRHVSDPVELSFPALCRRFAPETKAYARPERRIERGDPGDGAAFDIPRRVVAVSRADIRERGVSRRGQEFARSVSGFADVLGGFHASENPGPHLRPAEALRNPREARAAKEFHEAFVFVPDIKRRIEVLGPVLASSRDEVSVRETVDALSL